MLEDWLFGVTNAECQSHGALNMSKDDLQSEKHTGRRKSDRRVANDPNHNGPERRVSERRKGERRKEPRK